MSEDRKIRKAIQGMTIPFCISDLLYRLKEKGLQNKGLILRVLDDMYDEGLVRYDHIATCLDGEKLYAFYIMPDQKIINPRNFNLDPWIRCKLSPDQLLP